MIKPIITNKILLKQKCFHMDIEASDFQEKIQDLLDTAEANKENCAGLAFNQIGEFSRGFALRAGDNYKVFINPEYVMRAGGFKSLFESCLSRPNEDPIKKRRYKKIKLRFYNPDTKEIEVWPFESFSARAVQHEMDHLNGVLI